MPNDTTLAVGVAGGGDAIGIDEARERLATGQAEHLGDDERRVAEGLLVVDVAGAAVRAAEDREHRCRDHVARRGPPLEQRGVEVGGDVVAVGEQHQRVGAVPLSGAASATGPPPAAPSAGYQNSVGSVRVGAPPKSPLADVVRDVSSNVSVVVPTA